MPTRPQQSPASPHIRPATPADIPAILGFIRELALHEGRPQAATIDADGVRQALWPTDRPAPAEAWIIELRDDGGHARGVGYLWWSLSVATFSGARRLMLEDIALTSAARGGGVGTFTMHWLAAKALELGCTCIDWGVVDNNPRAMALYDRLGATRQTSGVHYRWSGEPLANAARAASGPPHSGHGSDAASERRS